MAADIETTLSHAARYGSPTAVSKRELRRWVVELRTQRDAAQRSADRGHDKRFEYREKGRNTDILIELAAAAGDGPVRLTRKLAGMLAPQMVPGWSAVDFHKDWRICGKRVEFVEVES